MLNITCPECNSRNVRSSLSQSLGENLQKALGFFQLRCRDCDSRFTHSLWDIRNLLYARCPCCYGLKLTSWNPRFYRAPRSWLFYMKVGGKARRCNACRRNFVSFRPAKGQKSARTAQTEPA